MLQKTETGSAVDRADFGDADQTGRAISSFRRSCGQVEICRENVAIARSSRDSVVDDCLRWASFSLVAFFYLLSSLIL